jgi:hypothetical protein
MEMINHLGHAFSVTSDVGALYPQKSSGVLKQRPGTSHSGAQFSKFASTGGRP